MINYYKISTPSCSCSPSNTTKSCFVAPPNNWCWTPRPTNSPPPLPPPWSLCVAIRVLLIIFLFFSLLSSCFSCSRLVLLLVGPYLLDLTCWVLDPCLVNGMVALFGWTLACGWWMDERGSLKRGRLDGKYGRIKWWCSGGPLESSCHLPKFTKTKSLKH